jgi:hypothetical protein
VAAGAVRELAHRGRAAVEDPGDLRVRVAEDVVQHEDRAFQRRQRLQHDEEGQRAGLDADRLRGGVGRRLHDRLGQPLPDVGLAPAGEGGPAGEGVVHRDPHQVRARLRHRFPGPAGPGQPGLLQHVLGVADGAEHVVGDGEQQRTMLQELPGRHLAGHAVRHRALLPVDRRP